MKYLLITDIPAPWRETVFEIVYKHFGKEFFALYCKRNEKRRLWKFRLGQHPKLFLRSITIKTRNTKENFINFGIIPFLIKNRPKIIVCFSLVPTVYLAMVVAKMIGTKIIVFADTWEGRDRKISWAQKWARIIPYRYFANGYIGASQQTLKWFKLYNKDIDERSMFLSALCADNEQFLSAPQTEIYNREYDLMFSGRIVEIKNPDFFVDVAKRIKKKLGKCKVLVIGDGDPILKNKMFSELKKNEIEYHYPGFIAHEELPKYYTKSKLFLFPTSGDCWGVVLNEAMICGMPVISTNLTAAAYEMILNGKNGYVLPLDAQKWADKAIDLLTDETKLESFSMAAIEKAKEYNFKSAASGIIRAIEHFDNK